MAVVAPAEGPPEGSVAGGAGCWVRILAATGQVILQGNLEDSSTIASVKEEIEKADGMPAAEQLLSVDGVPVGDHEVLRSYKFAALEGDTPRASPGVVEVSVRRVSPEWAQLLEDLHKGSASFDQVRARIRSEADVAQQVARDRGLHLKSLVEDMGLVFQDALKRVNESGSALLAAAGDLQRNRDTVFEIVPRSSKGCRQAAEELMVCRNSVLTAVQTNGQVLINMRSELGPAHKAVLKGLRESSAALGHAKEAWRREGELLRIAQAQGSLAPGLAEELGRSYVASLKAITRNGRELEATAEALSSCRQAYRRAVVVNRNAIRQAEASLQRDQEVIFGWAVDHVSDVRKSDRKFIMTVIEANGEALERAPEEFRHDREVVLLAVTQSDGWALQFAAEELRRDREIVMAAVRRNGWALEHASEDLKRDRGVVLAAVQANGEALEFAGEPLKRDREVVLTAVRRSGGWALQAAAAELRADAEVASAAVKQNSLILEHVGEALRCNKELVLAAVSANGLALEHVGASLREDRAVVEAAVRSNALALRFASSSLRKNREVVLAAVAKDGFALQHAAPELQKNRDVVLAAVTEGGPGVLEFASLELRGDPQLVSAAVLATKRKRQQEESVVAGADASASGEPAVATWNVSREGPECVQL